MPFVHREKPISVLETDSTEAIVRRTLTNGGASGESALLSDRILEILQDSEDILDVVALLQRSFRVKPSRKELSKVVTLGDLVTLFDGYRKKFRRE